MTSQNPTILHVIDTTGPGGAETVFLDIAEKMRLADYETLALIKGPGWVQSQLEAREIPFHVLKPYGFLSIPYYRDLIRLIRDKRVRLIQAHLLGSALTSSIIRFFTGIPVIATLHGQVDVNSKERFIALKRLILKFGLSKVVAVSGELADYLADRKLFTRSKIEVIHNGVDINKYGAAARLPLKEQLGLDAEALLIGSIGNIRPAKDYQTLVRAAKEVVERNPHAHFLIAGHAKEPLKGELDRLILHLGLDNHVHFIGFTNDTAGFLKPLSLFVLSSSAEGFSIATLEAMAAKIPVIATRCGGPEEILRDGVDGVLVPARNSHELAEAIFRALENNNISEMVSNAYERVTADFSLNALLIKYQRLAESILDHSHQKI